MLQEQRPPYFGLEWQSFLPDEEELELIADFLNDYSDWPEDNRVFLENTVYFASYYHHGTRRDDGSLYISHCFEVAKIVSGWGSDAYTIAGALLHDTVEDTPATLPQIGYFFGHEVETAVNIDTKVSKNLTSEATEKTILKLFEGIMTTEGARGVVIKLADRLHNMKTLNAVSSERQRRKALETLHVYFPLALAVNMQDCADELFAESIHWLYPRMYDDAKEKRNQTISQSEMYLPRITDLLTGLNENIDGSSNLVFHVSLKPTRLAEYVTFNGEKPVIEHRNPTFTVITADESTQSELRDLFFKLFSFDIYQPFTLGNFTFQLDIKSSVEMQQEEASLIDLICMEKDEDKEHFAEEKLQKLRQLYQQVNDAGDHATAQDVVEHLTSLIYLPFQTIRTPDGERLLLAGASAVDFAFELSAENIGPQAIGVQMGDDPNILPLNTILKPGKQYKIIRSNDQDPSQQPKKPQPWQVSPNHLDWAKTERGKKQVSSALWRALSAYRATNQRGIKRSKNWYKQFGYLSEKAFSDYVEKEIIIPAREYGNAVLIRAFGDYNPTVGIDKPWSTLKNMNLKDRFKSFQNFIEDIGIGHVPERLIQEYVEEVKNYENDHLKTINIIVKDHPGVLVEMLEVCASQRVNIARTRTELNSYTSNGERCNVPTGHAFIQITIELQFTTDKDKSKQENIFAHVIDQLSHMGSLLP